MTLVATVMHLPRPHHPFWGPLVTILDFAGDEQVAPAPLGQYYFYRLERRTLVPILLKWIVKHDVIPYKYHVITATVNLE